jgi:putative proteasome-type protease
MTYCIAVSVKDGLVLTSDSRTNAGIDNVSVHCKMHGLPTFNDRKIVLLSAGNLATTQAVLDQMRRDIKDCTALNLNTVRYLSEAAEYLGHVSLDKFDPVNQLIPLYVIPLSGTHCTYVVGHREDESIGDVLS